MEKIKHEGKTYRAVAATNMCEGCAFWADRDVQWGVPHCQAPNEVYCGGVVFVEENEGQAVSQPLDENYPSLDDMRLATKAILAAFVIIVLVIATVAIVARIIIRGYEMGIAPNP